MNASRNGSQPVDRILRTIARSKGDLSQLTRESGGSFTTLAEWAEDAGHARLLRGLMRIATASRHMLLHEGAVEATRTLLALAAKEDATDEMIRRACTELLRAAKSADVPMDAPTRADDTGDNADPSRGDPANDDAILARLAAIGLDPDDAGEAPRHDLDNGDAA